MGKKVDLKKTLRLWHQHLEALRTHNTDNDTVFLNYNRSRSLLPQCFFLLRLFVRLVKEKPALDHLAHPLTNPNDLTE